jgi:hypothetical protein
VLGEPFHQVDVRLFGSILTGALSRRPSVIFRPPFKIQHARPRTFDVPLDGLFVERVELEEPIGSWGLGQLFDPALGGLKIFFERHDGRACYPDRFFSGTRELKPVVGRSRRGTFRAGSAAVSSGLGKRAASIRCDVRPRVRSRLERFPQSLKGMAVKR